MIKHIVFWRVAPPGDSEAKLKVFHEFSRKTADLRKVVPEIIAAEVGLNLDGNAAFDVCIDSLFRSREALNAYIGHPEHLKVRAYMDGVTCAKTVFDYETAEGDAHAAI